MFFREKQCHACHKYRKKVRSGLCRLCRSSQARSDPSKAPPSSQDSGYAHVGLGERVHNALRVIRFWAD